MSGKHNRKIINFSINRQMQIRLFIKVLGVAFVGIGLMATIFYFYSNREIGGSYKQFHIHAKNFLDYLVPAVSLSVLAAVLFAIFITLFFPLKIAGPLFRIERAIKETISQGDFSVRIKLRDGDEVGNLADALNVSMEILSEKIKKIKISTDKLKSSVSGQDKGITDLVKEIEDELNSFKLME